MVSRASNLFLVGVVCVLEVDLDLFFSSFVPCPDLLAGGFFIVSS